MKWIAWFVLASTLALAACAAPSATPTATATVTAAPSAMQEVVSTRLLALLTGQLVLEGECLRVQSRYSPENLLLVWPADFDVSINGDAVVVSDLLLKKQITWHVGDTVEVGGGNIPRLDASLRPVPAECVGPYWVFGGWVSDATPTPLAATATPTPTPTPFSVFVAVEGVEPVNARGGPSTEYDVVGHLKPGQKYPVVGQALSWWQVRLNEGQVAWVTSVAVTITGSTQAIPVVTAPPTPTLPPPNVTDLAQGGLVTFTNTALGLIFSYQPRQRGASVATLAAGNRVYVYYTDAAPTDGQYVEEFHKDPGQTLEQAIQKQILVGFNPRACLLTTQSLADDTGYPHPDTLTYAMILPNVPPTVSAADDDMATRVAQAQQCPQPYTVNGGSVYFMADRAHPDRFFFFKIGQYWIYSNEGIPWQDTLQVTDAQP